MYALGQLLPVFASLTGLTCVRANGPDKVAPKGKITLSVFASNALGMLDEVAWSDEVDPPDETHPRAIETRTGHREATLRILCEMYQEVDGRTAWDVLEELRTRVHLTSTREALRACGVVFRGTAGPITQLPTTYDERLRSVASLDYRVGFVSQVTDTANPVDEIDRTEVLGGATT